MVPTPDSITQQARSMAKRLGRPLRILHLGNIANNALRNALVQRQAGIEADVVAYDYYHVMGAPEWELNTISGDYDAFAPDYWALSISGPARPEWYVQGPRALCLAMLRARQGDAVLPRILARFALIRGMDAWLSEKAQADGTARERPNLLHKQNIASTRHLIPEMQGWATWRVAFAVHVERLTQPEWWASFVALTRASLGLTVAPAQQAWIAEAPIPGALHALVRFAWVAPVVGLLKVFSRLRPESRPIANLASHPNVELAMDAIEANHQALFPELNAADRATDIAQIRAQSAGWADILPYYDIVQGYSLDGIIPLGCAHQNFTTYEHGTLREIPFEATSRGRLCWLTYSSAPVVFVTNSDVLPSVSRMGIPPERAICLPHAFDDSILKAFRKQHRRAAHAEGPPNFFAPARHHWQGGGGSWEKGNDVYLRAAGLLHSEGRDFRLTLIEWGDDVEASRDLITMLGFAHKVSWLPIQNGETYWQLMCEAHCVIDQFALPAIGGVSYEALTLGCRVITRIDIPVLERFFGASPPLLAAENVEQIVARMREVMDDADDAAGIGAASAEWAARYHSTERLSMLQLKAYEALLFKANLPA